MVTVCVIAAQFANHSRRAPNVPEGQSLASGEEAGQRLPTTAVSRADCAGEATRRAGRPSGKLHQLGIGSMCSRRRQSDGQASSRTSASLFQPQNRSLFLSLSLSPLLSHLHKHWHRFSSGQRQDRTGQKAQLREPGSGLKAAKATRKHIPQADDRQWSAIHPSYAGPAVHRRKKKTAQHNTQTHSTNVYKNGR